MHRIRFGCAFICFNQIYTFPVNWDSELLHFFPLSLCIDFHGKSFESWVPERRLVVVDGGTEMSCEYSPKAENRYLLHFLAMVGDFAQNLEVQVIEPE